MGKEISYETPEQRRERIRSQMGLTNLGYQLYRIGGGEPADSNVNPGRIRLSSRRQDPSCSLRTGSSGRSFSSSAH